LSPDNNPAGRSIARSLQDNLIGQFKSVEECEKVLINIGFTASEVNELSDIIKTIIDEILECQLARN